MQYVAYKTFDTAISVIQNAEEYEACHEVFSRDLKNFSIHARLSQFVLPRAAITKKSCPSSNFENDHPLLSAQ